MIASVNITQRRLTAKCISAGNVTAVRLSSRSSITAAIVGRQGPAGADGLMSAHLHTQSVAAAEWIVNHNFGYKPNVSVYDNGGSEVHAQIIHLSDNQLRVYFSAPQVGFARCI